MTMTSDRRSAAAQAANRGNTLPPHDIVAEEATLAALLIDESAYWRVEPIVRATDFFRETHEWVFRACEHLAARGETITIPTVAHELDRTLAGTKQQLDQAGGEPWLVELVARYFTAVGVEAHARIVARDARYRRLLQASHQIANLAWSGGPDDERVIEQATKLIDGIRGDSPMMGALTSEEIVQQILADDSPALSAVGNRGLTSGYASVDALIQGYAPGEVVAIGADTSVGKTAYAVGAARRQAQAGVAVGYIPVEGNRTVLTHRMAAGLAGFSLQQVRDAGEWSSEGMRRRYESALWDVAILPITWPDRYIERIGDICAWISVQVHQAGLQVVYVDHIDVVKPDRDRDNRVGEIADIMRQLQNTARRENVVIVYLSQINRQAAAKNRMPSIRDLREAGAKEELAQVIFMLWRDKRAQVSGKPKLHVTIGKNSEGPTGPVTRVDDERSMEPAFVFNPRSASIEEVGVHGG